MNEPIDPELLEEVERYEKLQQEVIESVRKNTINDLIEAQQVAEDLVTKINLDYPKPPTLEELMSIVQEEANELVQTQPKQISVTEETPTPAPKPAKTLAEKAANHITKEVKLEEKADSFQQPNPNSVDKNLEAVQKKLKFLEQAIGKIAATGPGGGAVNLKDLDDVDYASIVGATNNQVLTYNAASNLWISKSITGGGGIPTLDEVTTQGNTTTNDIFVGSATANYFAVNTTAGYTVTTGQIAWNAADLTFDMGMANGVTLQVGQEQYIKIKAANAITNGYTVMFAGANGEHILGTHCDTRSPGFRSEYFIGVATQDIAKNGFGYITTFGKVHDVNTLAFQEGDILYASPTDIGQFTTTEPTAPDFSIMVAAVTKRAGGDGHLMVRPSMRFDIHQLNDVVVATQLDGQSLVSSNNIWKNAYITTANTIEQGNLFYTNARVYANVLTLGHATNAQLSLYATNNQLTLYTTNAQAANFATIANLDSKANVTDLTTANVSEVTNLYYSNARVAANVATLGYVANTYVNTRLLTKANTADLTTSNVTEGTNLYFTNARVVSGISTGTVSNITVSGNTVLNGNVITAGLVSSSITGTPGSTALYNLRAANTVGGVGYGDFFKLTNASGGATNPNKYIRINVTGDLEIINSAYTAMPLSLTDNGDLTVSGNVIMSGIKSGFSSNRPAFRVTGANTYQNLSTTQNGDGVLNYNNWAADYNQGNWLNNTTGVFTAPVAGLYQINLSVRNAGNANFSQLICYKNGSTVLVMVEFAGNSTMNHTGASTVAKLNAGDTLTIKVGANTITFDGNDNWSVAYLG